MFCAEVGREALQLSSVIVPGRAIAFDECLEAGYERYDAT